MSDNGDRPDRPVPDRIRNWKRYRDSQPDLDIYAPILRTYAVSPSFAGGDVDGFLFLSDPAITMTPAGIWERNCHTVLLEHKAAVGCWRWGTWRAWNVQAENALLIPKESGRSTRVVATYGPPEAPTGWHWLPVDGWWSMKRPPDYEKVVTQRMDVAAMENVWIDEWMRSTGTRKRTI